MNLLIDLKVAGEPNHRVLGAARIKVDAYGRMTVYGDAGDAVECVRMDEVESISINSVKSSTRAA